METGWAIRNTLETVIVQHDNMRCAPVVRDNEVLRNQAAVGPPRVLLHICAILLAEREEGAQQPAGTEIFALELG
jgi:hypothetical protein